MLSPCGKDRYAISPWRHVVPIWGYVSRTKDQQFWTIERAGSILPVAYSSPMAAAQAVFELEHRA
jgi:hypothetical protein